jgi:hypothetical protein
MESLITNLDQTKIPKTLSLVIDSGAFNGSYGAGIVMYIKVMEDLKLIKVKRISGCSAGSILAVWYLFGCKEFMLTELQKVCNYFRHDYFRRRRLDANKWTQVVTNCIYALIETDEEVKSLHKRLYINYYDTMKGRQCVVRKFQNRQHLIDCILRSSHIPYFIDGKARRDKRYIDGMVPHIFTDKNTLFVHLITLRKIKQVISLQQENDVNYRMLAGVCDANEFFVKGNSNFCSFVQDWHRFYRPYLAARVYYFLFLTTLLDCWKLPRIITQSVIYKEFKARFLMWLERFLT